MITGLNSPLPGSKIESFKDLLCDRSIFDAKQDFNLTQWMDHSKISSYWNQVITYWESILSYESRDCFQIWSPASAGKAVPVLKLPVNDLFLEVGNTYGSSSIKDIMELSEGGTKPELLSYSDKIMLSLLYPGHSREPEEITRIRSQEKRYPTENELVVADETEITNCTQKSAYITDSDLTATELDFLSRNYAGKQFYSGKDDMISVKMEGLVFWRNRKTKIPNLYRWMMDSGIYERLEVEKVARKNTGREPLVKVKKEKERLEGVSSLSGGLITLFMLCGGLISLAVTSFIFLECRHIVLKLLGICCNTIWKFLVKYYLSLSMAFEVCWSKVKK
jgi:hypothetical protein